MLIMSCMLMFGATERLIAQNVSPASDFRYYLNAECTGIVIAYYSGHSSNVVIPSTIEGYPVVEVGFMAFNNKSLESITIPDSVKRIGAFAFLACSQLTTVKIGAKEIEYLPELPEFNPNNRNDPRTMIPITDGNGAFAGCDALNLKEQKKIRETGYKGRF